MVLSADTSFEKRQAHIPMSPKEFKEYCYSQKSQSLLLFSRDDDIVEVDGNVTLTGLRIVRPFPKHLRVKGNLFIKDVKYPIELPDNLIVDRYLHIEDCPKLEKLPKKLKIGNHQQLRSIAYLVVRNCPGLTYFSEYFSIASPRHPSQGLEIHNKVEIIDCAYLENISGLAYSKIEFLYLKNCRSVTALPEGMDIKTLHIEYCGRIKEFPSDLSVGLSFTIQDIGYRKIPLKLKPEILRVDERFVAEIPTEDLPLFLNIYGSQKAKDYFFKRLTQADIRELS